MPPAIIAAGIGAAAGIGGSLLSSSAQKKAANKASDVSLQTAQMNNALTNQIYNQNKSALTPFMETGTAAGGQLNALLANGPYDGGTINSSFGAQMDPGSFEDWKKNSGYDWNLERGMKGIGINAGAGGWLQSGAAIKGALDFQSGLASREWGNYRAGLDRYTSYNDAFAGQERGYQTDQYNNHLGQLANQQSVGLAGASALAGVGQNYVNTVSANNNSAGTAAANAALARGQANAGMYAGIGNALGQFAGGVGGMSNQSIYGMYPTGGALGM